MSSQEGFQTSAKSADLACRPGGSELSNDIDRNLVRHKVLSLRQKRQAEISRAVGHTFDGPGARNSDRLTWIGVDEDVERLAPPSSSSRLASSDASRSGSDDDEDADSTILGHYIQALPQPPQKLVHLDQLQRRPRPSFASEETCCSSHESSSHASCRLDDDVDVSSQHTTETTDNSSSPSSRRASSTRASIASRRLSQQCASVDLARSTSLVQALSSPLGPPPNMPLPPKPLSRTLTRALAEKRTGISRARSSSRASASSAGSPRSAASTLSSWKMAETRPASSRLRQVPGDRNGASHVSDEEMDGLRNISDYFPTPTTSYPPLSSELATAPQDATPMLRSSPRSISEPTRVTSPTPDGAMDTSSGASHTHDDHVKSAEGGGSSDSALSQVLDLTESRGVLAIGERMQQGSSSSQTGVFQIGLGARTFFRHNSNRQRRSASKEQIRHSSKPGRKPSMRDVPHEPIQSDSKQAPVRRVHHQRGDTMSKSMSELMLALDLEANEWRNGVGRTASIDNNSQPPIEAAQVSRSHVDACGSNATVPVKATSDSNTQAEMPASDSLPSLCSSGSQELSLDDSRGPPTAESSLVRPNSCKTSASFRVVAYNEDDHGASVDLVAIYNSYRLSDGTMASRFTAPVLRIEDPEGDEVADSELEGDASSDDVPRKRSKPSRKKSLGFEDQRATLRPRSSQTHHCASLPSKPSQAFRTTLVTTEEETGSTSLDSASPTAAALGEDPYAFYEFSPSLPPFMPTGVSPRDLTGRGTWSSIVARASEGLSRRPSIASVESFATVESGPVSLREIRATAQAKQRHAEAAHRAREHISDHFAAMSYRPFAIHDHAASLAREAGTWNARRASSSSTSAVDSPEGGRSGRSTSMSSVLAGSIAPSVGDYGTRWPVAIGADQGVGPDDAASLYSFHPFCLSRQASGSRPAQKVYVEFSMQTSPQQSPTASLFPPIESLTTDENADRADAQVGSDVRHPAAIQSNPRYGYLAVDAPLRRRKSTASLLSTHDLSAELDQPGLWPSLIRAPRLSSVTRRRSEGNHSIAATSRQEEDSNEESDLDVNADLEDLAEHSGIMDATRGYKRKLHVAGVESTVEAQGHGAGRTIASIPARSLRISAALDRIQAQRICRSAGWDSADDEVEAPKIATLRTPRRAAATGRPSLPGCDPTRPRGMTEPLRRSKSMASMAAAKRPPLSPSLLRARSPSPDLSVLTNPSDDEEELLTADLDLDTAELSRETILDEEFDTRIGQAFSTRFSNSGKGMTQPTRPSAKGDAIDASNSAVASKGNEGSLDGGSLDGVEDSKDSQQTVQLPTRSRTSSMSSVIEMIQEADELLSSTGHSIGHSSDHDTAISDSGGTSGHDPQRPNHVVAECIRDRISMRSRGLPTPVTLAVARSARFNGPAPDKKPPAFEVAKKAADFEGEDLSPSLQDTPDTMAGSEIWSSFHADRSSTVSTATTRSSGSTMEMPPAPRTDSNTIATAKLDEPQSDETLSAAASSTQLEKRVPFEASTTRVIPILRRKSSGLPVARASVQKHSRPSLPLPPRSIPSESPAGNASANIPSKPAIRRYQSVASLQTSRGPADSRKPAGYGSVRNIARYSDTSRATPSKSVHGVGESIAPSRLPSSTTASTTETLRSRSASEQGSCGSKIKPRLQSPVASGRSRIPSRTCVRASGLPRPA